MHSADAKTALKLQHCTLDVYRGGCSGGDVRTCCCGMCICRYGNSQHIGNRPDQIALSSLTAGQQRHVLRDDVRWRMAGIEPIPSKSDYDWSPHSSCLSGKLHLCNSGNNGQGLSSCYCIDEGFGDGASDVQAVGDVCRSGTSWKEVTL